MLGSTSQYDRMVLCSTNGKADWIREVTEAEGTLAALAAQTYNKEGELIVRLVDIRSIALQWKIRN